MYCSGSSPNSLVHPVRQSSPSSAPAHSSLCLSFIKLIGPESEYYAEAVDRFRSLCEGRKLVANIDAQEGPLLHLRLIDPQNPTSATDPYECINAELLRDGLATIDRKCSYLTTHPQLLKKFKDSVLVAKKDRAGMFEFGDVEEDD